MDDDLKRLMESNASETRRHFDIVAERLDKKIDVVAESVVALDQKLDRRIDDLELRTDRGFAETQQHANHWHDHVVDERGNDLSNRGTDDHPDRERERALDVVRNELNFFNTDFLSASELAGVLCPAYRRFLQRRELQ